MSSFLFRGVNICEYISDLSEVHQKEREGDACHDGGECSNRHIDSIGTIAELKNA